MVLYDLCVIGSGIAGACTFHHAVKEYEHVLLLEQFELMHTKGSSHGESRIIRIAYDDIHYSSMASKSLELWPQVPQFETFYKRTGGLDIGPLSDESINKVVQVSRERGYPHEVLQGQQFRDRFPQFSGLPDDTLAVYQPEAGMLNPNKIRSILLNNDGSAYDVEKHRIVEKERVEDLIEDGNSGNFTIVTNKGNRFEAKKLAICVGAYCKNFLKKHFDLDIQFEVLRMCYYYWKIGERGMKENVYMDNSPIWIMWGQDPFVHDEKLDLAYYGFPSWEKPGYIKTASHHPYKDVERGFDPDERAALIDEGKEPPVQKEKIDRSINFLKKATPEGYLDFSESYEEIISQKDRVVTCLYEMTPTEDFIIDYLPTKSGKKNVVMFGGGSGHGFKFGIVVGKMLLELLEHQNNGDQFSVVDVPLNKFLLDKVLIKQ
nr:unnamed protein product [Naegleria fowleri]